jgi:CheY-like chemotaxis protein
VQMPARRVAADQIPQAEAGKGSTASVAGMRLRLCIPRGPSQESLLVTLAAWGVEVQDLSFDGMLPPPSTVTNLINLMAKDDAEGLGKKLPSTNRLDLLFQGKGLVRPIYLVDSCVWRACKQAGVSSDVLSRTMGHVLGFLDEQDKICKDVRAYAAWSALVRPIKKSTLRQKLASASETPQQEASSPQQQPGTPTSSCSAHVDAHDHGTHVPSYCKAEQTGGEAAKSGKRKILIVDDHAVNQKVALRMIQKILGNDNVVADVANDGFEAVTLVTKSDGRPYDLVLMDVQMPGCDGLEATRRIRAWENEVRVLDVDVQQSAKVCWCMVCALKS